MDRSLNPGKATSEWGRSRSTRSCDEHESHPGFAAWRRALRVFLLREDRDDLLRRFEDLAIPNATASEARIVRLENGIPRYGEDMTERYLVQETQATHGVHFNKGCYLGQEIVERVRSRAQIHR